MLPIMLGCCCRKYWTCKMGNNVSQILGDRGGGWMGLVVSLGWTPLHIIPSLSYFKGPERTFIYFYLGVGIIMCWITFIGCIAAETINGCCLCSYTLLIMVLILVEGTLVAFITIDHQWEKDLPFDATGELENLRSFIKENIDFCKWVGITMVIIQASSLLLALILKSMVSSRKDAYDCEDDYNSRRRTKTREPLLNPQSNQTSRAHSDMWSSLMREKYGLNDGDKYNRMSQSSSVGAKTR